MVKIKLLLWLSLDFIGMRILSRSCPWYGEGTFGHRNHYRLVASSLVLPSYLYFGLENAKYVVTLKNAGCKQERSNLKLLKNSLTFMRGSVLRCR